MEQVSVPMRIALAAVLAFAAVWFVMLRPKPVEDTASTTPAPATAPGAEGLGKAVDGAKGAVTASQDAAAATGAGAAQAAGATPAAATPAPAVAAPAAAAKPAAAATPKPEAVTDASAPLLRALDRGQAVVLLFTSRGADDRAAARAVRRAVKGDPRVVAKVVPVARVADFGAITTGVQVKATPATIVVGPNRGAQLITGFTEAKEVQQAVEDRLNPSGVRGESYAAGRRLALRVNAAGRRLCEDDVACRTYVSQANAACIAGAAKVLQAVTAAAATPVPAGAPSPVRQAMTEVTTAFRAVGPPPALAAQHAKAAGILARQETVVAPLLANVTSPAGLASAARRAERLPVVRSGDRQLRGLGYPACG